MSHKSRLGRLRRALLSRISLLKYSLNYDPYYFMLLGGEPSSRRLCLYRRTQAHKMQQQQKQQQQQQRQQHQEQQGEESARGKVMAPGQSPQHLHQYHHQSFFHLGNSSKTTKETAPPQEGVQKSTSQPGVSIEQLFEDTYSALATAAQGSSGTSAHGSIISSSHLDHVKSGYSLDGGLGINGSSTLPSSRVVAAQRRLAKMSLALSTAVISKNSSSIAPTSVSSISSLDPNLLRKRASSIPSLPSATATTSLRARSSDVINSTRDLTSRSARAGGSGYGSGSGSRSAGVARGAGGGEAFCPVSGATASKEHAACLTEKERAEVKAFKTVYYLGQLSAKTAARDEAEKNEGFDDKDGFYVCKQHDHLLFRYEIQDVLGKGTFGQVVKAWDHKTNSLVALKIVKNEKPFLKQAKEEVRILEVLKKQDKNDIMNLVHIMDSFKFRGHVCITFELLGISLHQLLKKTRGQGFSLSRIQKLTRGILRCLDLLAKNRLIHCDIKPENILLRRSAPGVSASSGINFSDTSIKVIDFGSSCYEQQQIYTYIQSRYYRAPEVILGARYTSAIDMWSLACVIGELYTAHPLFAGDDEHDQLASIMEVRGMPPTSLIGKCKRWDKFFSGETPRYLNSHSKAGRRGAPMSVPLSSALKDTEDFVFLDFMQRALLWDPGSRLTAADALQHAWIQRGQAAKTLSATDSKASSGHGALDTSKTKTQDKVARQDALPGLRRLSSSKTAPASGHSINKISVSSHCSTGSQKNITLTAKLPSNLVRPRSDTTSLTQKARAGPAIGLPPWDSK